MKVVRKASGGDEKSMDFQLGGIDDDREPGMTDAQLRDKIVQQLKARGLDRRRHRRRRQDRDSRVEVGRAVAVAPSPPERAHRACPLVAAPHFLLHEKLQT